MADFRIANDKTKINEGGWVNDPDDPGAETYKGITRKYFSKWYGWVIIDEVKQKINFEQNRNKKKLNTTLQKNIKLQEMIDSFYEVNFWDVIKGDDILNQNIANSIYDFGVNAHPKIASRLAQIVCGTKPDGVIGSKTILKLNQMDEKEFLSLYSLAKIGRYIELCEKNPKLKKFFYGWIKRVIL